MLRSAIPLVALVAVVQASLYGESSLNHTCQLRPSSSGPMRSSKSNRRSP
jgi:hypothetical protein